MNATRSSLTPAQRRAVYRRFRVYRNDAGSVGTGLWVYQPHDFDGAFELWSGTFATRRAAVEAAYEELRNTAPDAH